MDDLRLLVGANVRRLRRERNLAQGQLAEAIGRSVDMVSRLERGDAAPSFETIASLAGALTAHPAEIFGGRTHGEDGLPVGLANLVERLVAGGEEQALWLGKLMDHLERRP